MPTMVLLSERSQATRLGAAINLHPEFIIPEGYMLSWEHHFLDLKGELKNAVLIHGKAKILATVIANSLVVRIESPNVKDLMESIELVILYVGGKVITFDSTSTNCSFVVGIRNDYKWVSSWIARSFRTLRQRLGFKIAV